MKIRPVILCGGAGTRLWPDKKKHQAKQFIDFGGWSLIQKTLERINKPIFDFPIISTNLKYLKNVKLALKKSKIKKFKIVLEPAKKNTAPAILASKIYGIKVILHESNAFPGKVTRLLGRLCDQIALGLPVAQEHLKNCNLKSHLHNGQ